MLTLYTNLFLFQTEKDGVIDESKVHLTCWETHSVQEISLVPENPAVRFQEWYETGTFHDINYNLLRKNFMLENEIFFKSDYKFTALQWIMFAKVLVKTPQVCYIRRDSPDSGSRIKQTIKITEYISDFIEVSREMDNLFKRIDFFKYNEDIKYIAKARLLNTLDCFFIHGSKFYQSGITPEIRREVDNIFKKYFGENYFYPAFLFHWIHSLYFNFPVDNISISSPTTLK